MTIKTINPGGIFRTIIVAAGNGVPFPFGGRLCGFDVSQAGAFSAGLSIKDNASAEILVLVFPGADASFDFNISLDGPGAACNLYGLYLCPECERPEIKVEMNHRVHDCSSHQLFKGIVSGTARACFYGKITVAPDAQKTEAFQENHNLLLSDTARVDTMPQLEIYADDVKCSHGATVGKLDLDEQFYMRSRGIPESEARVLQMVSFISSVLEMLPDGDEKDALADYVAESIRKRF